MKGSLQRDCFICLFWATVEGLGFFLFSGQMTLRSSYVVWLLHLSFYKNRRKPQTWLNPQVSPRLLSNCSTIGGSFQSVSCEATMDGPSLGPQWQDFSILPSDKRETCYEYWIPTALSDSYGQKKKKNRTLIYVTSIRNAAFHALVYATVTQQLKQTLREMERIF